MQETMDISLHNRQGIRFKAFARTFTSYSVFSFLVFFFSSAGWPTVFWLYYGGGYFLGLITIVCITYLFSRSWRAESTVRIPKPLLVALLLSQLLLILFNPSDCGDAPVKGWDKHVHVRFLERAMAGFPNFCHIAIHQTEATTFLFHSPFTVIMTSLAVLYFPYLLAVVAIYLWRVFRCKMDNNHLSQ